MVQHVHGLRHALHRPRLVHASESRRALLGHVPQRPGRAAGRELDDHERERQRGPIQQLGRTPLSNNATSVTVNLVEPGTLYGDRVNEFDIRLAKILQFGRTRTNVGFDLYNILNSAPILSYNQAFSPTTRRPGWSPTGVLQPRFWKFSVQVDFDTAITTGQRAKGIGQRAGG